MSLIPFITFEVKPLNELQNDELVNLKAALEIALEVCEALGEYDEQVETADRRDSKKLLADRDIYKKSVDVERKLAEEVIGKYCNLDFSSKDAIAYSSYLRIVDSKVDAEYTKRKLKLKV